MRRDAAQRIGALVSLLFLLACAARDGTPRPNVIFILTDDQAAWALGAAGNSDARTPHLDRLAEEGARLTGCFVTTPICSPARASLLTGRYATEVGLPDYIGGTEQKRGLDPGLPTWPRLFAEAGYATALVGKWHLGKADRYLPEHFGYREFVGFRMGGKTSRNPTVETRGELTEVAGFTPDILTDAAIDFVERSRGGPFLLSLHYRAPHVNTDRRGPDGDVTWLPVSTADWEPFRRSNPALPHADHPDLDRPRVRRMLREYLASTASADRNVGRLLARVDELGLREDTIVVFTSDHGFNLGHHGIWHKGNGFKILVDDDGFRPNVFDDSLRVPAVVRWPGVVPAGIVVDDTVTNLDWFPTLLDMAGVDDEGALTRGASILPLLRGESLARSPDLFAQYAMWDWHQTGANLRTYRTPDWKLVRDFAHTGRNELYDLRGDPEERVNRIRSGDSEARAARRDLEKRLLESMRAIDDPALAAARFGE